MVGARRRARAQHRHALAALGRRDARRRPRGERARRSRRARPGRRRRDAISHRDRAADPRRGRRRRVARQRRRGRDARRRRRGDARASSRSAPAPIRPSSRGRPRGRSASSRRSRGRSITSPTASGVVAIANGDPLLATITGTGCMSSAITGCFLAVAELAVRRARSRRSSPSASPARTRRVDAQGPGSVPRRPLRRARGARPGDARRQGAASVRVHAIVDDLETARRAIEAGATVVQLRVKAPTDEVVARGQGFRGARHDVRRQRRRRRGARARRRRRASRPVRRAAPSRARARGLLLGRSATTYDEARRGRRGLPRRRARSGRRPSKADADPPLGLGGARARSAPPSRCR